MIAIDAGQALLASKSTVRQVTLVRLRTFTNRAALTVAETFYLASLPVRYQWTAPTVVDFEPLLRSASPVIRGINHLPDGETISTRDGIVLELDATERRGVSLWVRMQSQQLIGALVDVASLLVDADRFASEAWADLSGLGAVATIRWRGEVTSVSDFDFESGVFSLVCDTVEPSLPWPFARDPATNDPRDVGKRYPIPFGIARQVDLVGIEVGHATTLVGDVAETGTAAWSITDGLGFPTTGTGLVKVGEEVALIDFATSSPTSLVVSARAQNGTASQAHPRGSTVVELVREARWVMSAVEAQTLSALYWQLSDGQRIRIPNTAFGFNPGCDALEAGQSLAVVSFDAEQLTAAISAADAQLQQPAYELGENSLVRLTWTGTGVGNAAATGGSGVSNGTAVVSASPTGLRMTYSAAGALYGSAWTIDTGFGAEVVIRLRPVFDVAMTSDAGFNTFLRYVVPTITLSGSSISSGGTQEVRTYSGVVEDRRLIFGDWITPSVAGVWTVADLVGTGIGAGLRCVHYLNQAAGGTANNQALVYTPSSYWEVEIEPPPVVRTRAADALAAFTVGNGLRLVADCRGLVTRSSEAAVSALDFSTTTGWSAINCSISVQTVDGRQCIRLDTATDEIVELRRVGLAADWSLAGGSISLEVFIGAADKDRLESAGGKAVEVRLESTGGETRYRFGPADLVDDEWTTLVVDLARHPNRITTGTGANLAAVANIRFGAEWRVGTIPPSATPDIFFRNVRFMARTLSQQALDVARWFVEDFAGLTGSVDGASFSAAKTNTPGVNLGGDLRRLGASFGEILARLEFETRVSWIQTEGAAGTIFKPQAALATYDWPAASRTLEGFRRLVTVSRQLDEMASEFSALYDYRADFDAANVEAFRELARADAEVNDISADVPTVDITAAQALVGLRPSEPQEFRALPTLAAVVEVWAYYVAEALRYSGRRFSMTVDYQTGFDLEPGDIVEFATPWDGATVKARVLRIAFPFDEPDVGLSLEEIP